MKNYSRLRHSAIDFVYIVAGSACFGTSIGLFSAPNNIAPGGLSGLMTLANYLWGLPIGTLVLVANIPLLAVAWLVLGRGFAARTVMGTVVSSVVIDVATALLPAFSGDRLLAAIFGGVLAGTGLGLILSRGATTGGAEIIAHLLERRYPHIPIGKLILLLDGIVIGLSALVYGELESPLYAIILVYISSVLTDRLVYGGQKGSTVLIISKQHKAISSRIIAEMQRGVTLLDATGGYTGEAGQVLLCAVRRRELYTLKQLALNADPAAFLLLIPADEVHGLGFRRGEHPPKFDKIGKTV